MHKDDFFETDLLISAYQAITDRLMGEHLLTNQEAAIIRKRLSRLKSQLAQPKTPDGPHARIKEAA